MCILSFASSVSPVQDVCPEVAGTEHSHTVLLLHPPAQLELQVLLCLCHNTSNPPAPPRLSCRSRGGCKRQHSCQHVHVPQGGADAIPCRTGQHSGQDAGQYRPAATEPPHAGNRCRTLLCWPTPLSSSYSTCRTVLCWPQQSPCGHSSTSSRGPAVFCVLIPDRSANPPDHYLRRHALHCSSSRSTRRRSKGQQQQQQHQQPHTTLW